MEETSPILREINSNITEHTISKSLKPLFLKGFQQSRIQFQSQKFILQTDVYVTADGMCMCFVSALLT